MSKLWESLVNIIYDIGDRSGCHQLPERSFFYKGRPFPICARCTGVAIGQLSACVVGIFVKMQLLPSALFLAIMGVDWGLQEFGIKYSTNFRRLVTGFLGGFGLFSIYIICAKKLFSKVK